MFVHDKLPNTLLVRPSVECSTAINKLVEGDNKLQSEIDFRWASSISS